MSTSYSMLSGPANAAAFSGSQQVALAVVPLMTGFFSLLGASCIVYIILRDRKRSQNLSKTYHRLLLGMSATDIIGSIRACTSSFVMPAGSWWMAAGNQGSCEFQGSVAQLAIGAALYSACLGIYFWLTIRNVNKSVIARRVEPVMHCVSLLFPICTAIYGLIQNIFNPVELGVGCWVSSFPTGCADDPNIECTRGQNAKVLIWIFAGIPVGLSLVRLVSCD
jgi:tellurite resistance protein TehA-like permease